MEDALEDFLVRRGVPSEVIRRMDADKIDCEALVVMTDQQLTNYFPAYGDRIAIMAFAKCKTRKNEPSSENSTLRKRHLSRQMGNKNAQRKSRKMELGWLNCSAGNIYKQVRTRNGGGTRHLTVDKNVTVSGILQVATATFFPGGVSKLGNLSDFICKIKDFKGDSIVEQKNIDDLYKDSQLRTLRLYLYTRSRETTERSEAEGTVHQQVQNVANEGLEDMIDSEGETTSFIEAGTPSIQFRNRLSRSLNRARAAPTVQPSSVSTSMTQQRRSDITRIEILDSEDEEIERALESAQHLEPPSSTRGDIPEPSVADILQEFQDRYVKNDRTNCVIYRAKPLDSAIRILERKTVNLQNKLFVKFSGEMGEDHGGPRREFFRLAIADLQRSNFFEGPEGSRVFTHDLQLVEKGHYRTVGRLVALSLIQDGPGVHCLNKQLFALMTGSEGETTTTPEEIMAPEIQECLEMAEGTVHQQVQNVANEGLEDMIDSEGETTSFIEAGTPSIQFRNRLSRSLNRARAAPTVQPSSVSTSMTQQRRPDITRIEILDSEDEEIERALESAQHLEPPSSTRGDIPEPSVADILQEFQDRYVKNDRTNCVIYRAKPLDSAIRILERKTVNLQNKLFVKFSGEMGEDHGGPRREFFRLAIADLQRSNFFEGPEGSRVFTHDLQLVEKGHYRTVGRLVALSLIQDGPGVHCLNKQLFALMTGSEGETTTTPEEIMAPEIQECLEMLEKITTNQQRDQFLAKFGDWLIDRGINAYRMAIDDKRSMKEMIIKYYVFYRTSAEITQFKDGMNDVGELWGLVTKYADKFQPLFCHQPKALTKQEMDKIVRYDLSDIGSNFRRFEDDTVYSWELFLQDIEDGNVATTMAELLAFMSGASSIPPCGFHKLIDIHFYTQEDRVMRLPYVSTCSLEMWLPRGQEPEMLSALLKRCLTESQGFLKI